MSLPGPAFTGPATGLAFSVAGETTGALEVSTIVLGAHPNALRFRAGVSNACGTVTSNAAALTVCPADADCDGFVTGDDFQLFVEWFEIGDIRADFDGDGFLSGDDFELYVTAFEAGC